MISSKVSKREERIKLSQTQGDKLETEFTSVAIHSHPGHLQPKTLMFTLRGLVE